MSLLFIFFFSSRRRHTRFDCDWSSDVCSSDLGSGKTTLLNVITGYVKPDRGRIRYQGKDITGLSPRAVADLGIARSFQMPQLYLSLTVLENLVLALAIRAGRAQIGRASCRERV